MRQQLSYILAKFGPCNSEHKGELFAIFTRAQQKSQKQDINKTTAVKGDEHEIENNCASKVAMKFPPPLKLRPYGGIEMCVLLLLCSINYHLS